jgi:hypothetical protein
VLLLGHLFNILAGRAVAHIVMVIAVGVRNWMMCAGLIILELVLLILL